MNKIILIPSLAKGGAERIAENLFNYSNLFDYVVVFDGRIVDYNIPRERIIDLRTPATISLFGKFINFIKRYFKLKRLKKKLNISLCLSLLEPANLFNVLTKGNEKVVLSFRAHYGITLKEDPYLGKGFKREILKNFYKLIIRKIYSQADLLTIVSQNAKQELIKNFNLHPKKTVVIYNPITRENIVSLAKESLDNYQEIFKAPVIITAGRLTKQKAQWYLIRIFKELKKIYSTLKLVILGEGELKDYLIKLSEDLNLKTYVWNRDVLTENYDVYFLGFQKNPFKFIARAKLFLFPSLWEGFPNALIEAMACGVPVVSSDCRSGPREILAPTTDFESETEVPEFAEYGVLMPVFEFNYKKANEPLDKVELIWKELLIKLLMDNTLLEHYSQKALKRSQDFDLKKIVDTWKKVINNLF